MSKPEPVPKYLVYGLVDPRTLGVEYVGQSTSGLRRPSDHRKPSSLRVGGAKNIWLRELFAAGSDYEIVILGSVEDPEAPGTLCWWLEGRNTTALDDLEIWHIAHGRASGWTLKNQAAGGSTNRGWKTSPSQRERMKAGAKDRMTPAVIARIKETIRNMSPERQAEVKHNRIEGQRRRSPESKARAVEATRQPGRRAKISAAMREPERNAQLVERANSKENLDVLAKAREKLTPDVYARASETKRGSKHTPDAKAKMSVAQSNRTPEHRERLGEVNRGKILPTTTRDKISASLVTWFAVNRPIPECGTRAGYERALRLRKQGQPNCGPCALCRRFAAERQKVGNKRRAAAKATPPR